MNLLDVLKLDSLDMEEEQKEVVSSLRKLGLTDYEARAYTALVMQGHGTADEIADIAGIPRTSTYKVLESLKERGFATYHGGRPTVFHPVAPLEAKEKLCSEVSKTFSKLDMMQGMLSDRGTPQLVYTISGKDRVLAKIGEMLDAAQEHFTISGPEMRTIANALEPKFKEALKRGVEILVVAEPSSKVPESSRVIRKQNLIATDVLCDGEMAMIASPDLSLCGFTDNPFLVLHLENFMKLSWEKAAD